MKLFFTFALAAFATASFAQTTYTLAKIGGVAGYNYSTAYGLNDHGEVVGYAQDTNRFESVPYVWTQGGGLQTLPTIGGTIGAPGTFYSGQALGVNNAGNVAGLSTDANYNTYATLWSPDGAPHSLGTPNGGNFSYGIAINNRDEVAGYYNVPNQGASVACLLTYGFARESLGELEFGRGSAAYGINDHGTVVGEAGTSTGGSGFVWTRDDGMQALPSIAGDDYSEARDVNNSGEIVGNSFKNLAPGMHAFTYTAGGGLQSLYGLAGDDYASVQAVNDAGFVVGTAGNSTGYRASLWTPGGACLDLNSELDASGADWQLDGATNINASGQVLAYGQYFNGTDYYYGPVLLTPNAVPEPASLAALGLGALGLLRRRRAA